MPRKAKEEIIEDKKVNTKKSTKSTKKTSTKKTTKGTVSKTAQKSVKKIVAKKLPVVEYYDLPNLYNQTIVKILAQTPIILFVYWDISIKDKKSYTEKYGENFFNDTFPYLIVTNKTKNYSFEVEINDYANSWYIHIPDSDCKYDVSLIRKPKEPDKENIYITSSNNIQSPNDHILFDSLGKTVFLKNIKTNNIEAKNISSLSFINNIGRIYNIYDLYKEMYKNELIENKLDANLTSSKMSS